MHCRQSLTFGKAGVICIDSSAELEQRRTEILHLCERLVNVLALVNGEGLFSGQPSSVK